MPSSVQPCTVRRVCITIHTKSVRDVKMDITEQNVRTSAAEHARIKNVINTDDACSAVSRTFMATAVNTKDVHSLTV